MDYTYDGNGNLLTDLNKDIGSQTTNGIIYNHLSLPWQVSFRSATGTKGTITYIYDATGTKLKKTTLDSAGNVQTVNTYIGPFQYQGAQSMTSGITPVDTLKFFGHEEGRVRVEADPTGGQSVTSYEYDYFLKDHLGNTRMVLTDETQTDMYPAATMEVSDSATENLYYMNLDSTRSALPPGYPTDTTTNPNNYVAKVSSDGTVPAIGPGIVLKVMAGDQFSIRVSSWYRLNGTSPGTPVSPLTDLLASLISGIGGVPNPEGPGLSALQANTPTLSSNVMQFLQDTGTSIVNTKPHAFVNWILLDNQFNYVAASSGFSQVGSDQQLQKTVLTNLPITSSGYLYIYTSNETPNVDVFFDNLQVTHTRGPLLEENHYYPFGLTMAGISDKALKSNYAENKYRFQKQELQNKEFSDGSGLEMYEFKYRFDDCQIGRFWSIDPLASKYEYNSPYAFSENHVTGHVELEGLEKFPINPDDPFSGDPNSSTARSAKNQQAVESQRAAGRAVAEANSSGGSPNSGSSASETKKGESKGSEPLIGQTTTDKTLKDSHTFGNSFLGTVTVESYSGVTTGTEGKIGTLDGSTEAGKPDGLQLNVADVEVGVDKSGNATVGKNLGIAEFHVTGAGLLGDHAGIGESQPTGKNTVSGNEITYKPGTAVKAVMWGAAAAGSAALAGTAIAVRIFQSVVQ
jgi:RHS repeat-associated protein